MESYTCTRYIPEICEQMSGHITWVGFEPTIFANLGMICSRFYQALFTPEGHLKALPHYKPWSLCVKSLLKPSQLPGGEYAACATNAQLS